MRHLGQLGGSALVVEDGSLVGILTERDVVRAVADGANPDKAQASDYMSRMLTAIGADETMDEAARMMISQRICHLPVVDGGQIAGVLSIRAVLPLAAEGSQIVMCQIVMPRARHRLVRMV